MTEIIKGEYGYLKVNSNSYECYGGKTIQGICYKADPKYWLNQENFNKTPLNFPLYADEYDLVDDEHSHFETKKILIEAAKEYLYSEELEMSDDNIHHTIVVALLTCDWQSCAGYIYNELNLADNI